MDSINNYIACTKCILPNLDEAETKIAQDFMNVLISIKSNIHTYDREERHLCIMKEFTKFIDARHDYNRRSRQESIDI